MQQEKLAIFEPETAPMRPPLKNFKRFNLILLVLLCVVQLSACGQMPESGPGWGKTQTLTPFQPATLTLTLPANFTDELPQTPVPPTNPTMWADPAVPLGLRSLLQLPEGWSWTEEKTSARLRLMPGEGEPQTKWVYALVAPFPTVPDEVSLARLRAIWRGAGRVEKDAQPLFVSESTLHAFEGLWGPAAQEVVQVLPETQLAAAAWAARPSLALIPFDELNARWKVLRVDGKSPLDRDADLQGYPLVIHFGLHPSETSAGEGDGSEKVGLPATNRDVSKMTVVTMTGTSALVRAVGWRMEGKGMTYPARDILSWLKDTDFLHISNEASFNPKCPVANPRQESLMFCSRMDYIQLYEAIGANIIEISGNHNNDWGSEANANTIGMFRQRGWGVFAGGLNAEEARQPLLISHNGNRLAFTGCNYVGPSYALAKEDEAGAAQCDLNAWETQIQRLRKNGYLPVMTFQYNEIYISTPSEGQARDFKRMSEAGAVVVSGSQAHFPQGFAFTGENLIHYGLGNLFFDQMDIPVVGTRREFIDRHVFYDGKYISTELLTAMLEDYSRPRPMTSNERAKFLTELFSASGW